MEIADRWEEDAEEIADVDHAGDRWIADRSTILLESYSSVIFANDMKSSQVYFGRSLNDVKHIAGQIHKEMFIADQIAISRLQVEFAD